MPKARDVPYPYQFVYCLGAVMWFRNDLRMHDNEALAAANREGTSLLPVFCFDPREFGSGGAAASRGGPRPNTTGPYRAQCAHLLQNTLSDSCSMQVRVCTST